NGDDVVTDPMNNGDIYCMNISSIVFLAYINEQTERNRTKGMSMTEQFYENFSTSKYIIAGWIMYISMFLTYVFLNYHPHLERDLASSVVIVVQVYIPRYHYSSYYLFLVTFSSLLRNQLEP
ncbi:hypothetical protein ACJX0J_031078, partial [Zea mays]